MRKITEDSIDAFMSGHSFKRSNTEVKSGPVTRLYLFDNCIAKKIGEEIHISNAGWQTITTKERLNGIPGVNIIQRKGNWFLKDSKKCNYNFWDGKWKKI